MRMMHRSQLGTFLAVTASLGAAWLACGCEDKKPVPASPPASASLASAPVASASAGMAAFEQRVAQSEPLKPKPKPVTIGKSQLTIELCKVEAPPFLHSSNMNVLKAIAFAGDKLYLVDAQGAMRGYSIGVGEGCSLTIDKSFGEGGTLTPKHEVRALSSGKGLLVASSGVFGNYVLKDGKVAYECNGRGYVQLHPSGTWGLGSFANATVQKIAYGADSCTFGPWVLQDLSDDGKRKGPFSNVNAVGFVGDRVLVGGVLAQKVGRARPTVVVAFDENGKEKFRFGNTARDAKDDNFGWVHDIEACTPGICVLDSNFRRLSVWTKDGKFIGQTKLSEALDLRYPWIPAMADAGGGVMYLVAGQERGQGTRVSEGLIYRISGL